MIVTTLAALQAYLIEFDDIHILILHTGVLASRLTLHLIAPQYNARGAAALRQPAMQRVATSVLSRCTINNIQSMSLVGLYL